VSPDPALFGTVWVHVFEEDTADGATFRPETADIPLSRRPRERVRLHEDGSAELFGGGADDRPVPQGARWTEEGGTIVVRDGAGRVRLRIGALSSGTLVAHLHPRG
jgi:hypothetical protein